MHQPTQWTKSGTVGPTSSEKLEKSLSLSSSLPVWVAALSFSLSLQLHGTTHLSRSTAAPSLPDHHQNPRRDGHKQNQLRRLKGFESSNDLSRKAFQLGKFGQVLNHGRLLLHQLLLPQLPQLQLFLLAIDPPRRRDLDARLDAAISMLDSTHVSFSCNLLKSLILRFTLPMYLTNSAHVLIFDRTREWRPLMEGVGFRAGGRRRG